MSTVIVRGEKGNNYSIWDFLLHPIEWLFLILVLLIIGVAIAGIKIIQFLDWLAMIIYLLVNMVNDIFITVPANKAVAGDKETDEEVFSRVGIFVFWLCSIIAAIFISAISLLIVYLYK